MKYILIDINSDVAATAYCLDTDHETAVARQALCDAGLGEADVWAGDPTCPDSYRTGSVLFACDTAIEAFAVAETRAHRGGKAHAQ